MLQNPCKTLGFSILNEHIKCSSHIFLPLYEQLFNTILDTGVFPDQWTIGSIHPRGDRENVKKYRPKTILSCLGSYLLWS